MTDRPTLLHTVILMSPTPLTSQPIPLTFTITDVLRSMKSERTSYQCRLALLSMTQVTSEGVDVEAELEAADRAEIKATKATTDLA